MARVMSAKNHLKIHPVPFKSSRLATPPSPFTPITPFHVPSHPQPVRTNSDSSIESCVPPPPSPLQWLWQCHQCQRTYPLGATRRCLDDGHFFCSGTTTLKNWRKTTSPRKIKQRHRPCASEFDYVGWKAWGRWRRSITPLVVSPASSSSGSSCPSSSSSPMSSASPFSSSSSSESDSGINMKVAKKIKTSHLKRKDCWNNCDYPSECRWGRQYGVHTPTTPVAEVPQGLTQKAKSPTLETPDGAFRIEHLKNSEEAKKGGAAKGDFWGALLASATRRKSIPPSSPLSSVGGARSGRTR